MPLIASVARIYRHVPAVDRAELMQEGVVGVLRALERYDPELGTPFWAYASWWVREAMQQLVSELSRPVVLSDRALRQLARVRNARHEFESHHAHEPSLQELAAASDLTLGQLQRLVAVERQPRALEEPVDGSSDGGATFGDMLSDPCAEDAYEELAMRLGAADVPRLLGQLGDRERTIIEARYGLDGPERTLRELGQAMGVSAERIRQIEQTALAKMLAACLAPAPAPAPAGAVQEAQPWARVAAPAASLASAPRDAKRIREPRSERRGGRVRRPTHGSKRPALALER